MSHDEVVKIGSEFIATRETMQEILVNKFPVLLIDESQDTKKELVDALLCVYEKHKNWAIGMFGDTMQKIYADGKDHLDEAVPQEWVFPQKIMNHRSAERIVGLANAVRKLSDGKEQRPRSDAKKGFVRLFIANVLSNKEQTEKLVAEKMSEITSDIEWQTDTGYECLILEHHMAASRFSLYHSTYATTAINAIYSLECTKSSKPSLALLAARASVILFTLRIRPDSCSASASCPRTCGRGRIPPASPAPACPRCGPPSGPPWCPGRCGPNPPCGW